MKRVGRWAALGIGIVLIVGFVAVKPGYAEGKEHEPTCTLETLTGRYLFANAGLLLPHSFGVTESTAAANAAGIYLFHGDGTATNIVTVRINGITVLENAVSD